MKRFRNILLIANDRPCEAALDRAVLLAKENRARLTVVAVHERFPQRLRPLARSMFTEEPQELIARQQLYLLDELVAPLKADGVEVHTKALIGTPFIEIIREVIRGRHDLVMKPAEGRGGSAALLLGASTCACYANVPALCGSSNLYTEGRSPGFSRRWTRTPPTRREPRSIS